MADDGGVDEHKERLGDERTERWNGEGQYLAIDTGRPVSDR
ncbi:hypothetical protein [Cellulomonas fengjieae]